MELLIDKAPQKVRDKDQDCEVSKVSKEGSTKTDE